MRHTHKIRTYLENSSFEKWPTQCSNFFFFSSVPKSFEKCVLKCGSSFSCTIFPRLDKQKKWDTHKIRTYLVNSSFEKVTYSNSNFFFFSSKRFEKCDEDVSVWPNKVISVWMHNSSSLLPAYTILPHVYYFFLSCFFVFIFFQSWVCA